MFISGVKLPATPEELMRSRYTAYTKLNINYITATMKSPANDGFDSESARDWASSVDWIKLDVVASSVNESKGFVEFIAYFIDNKKKRHAMHELSEFHLIDGVWFYVDGKTLQ